VSGGSVAFVLGGGGVTLLRTGLNVLARSAQRLFKLRLKTDDVSWSPLDDGVPGSENALIVLARHAGPGDSLLLMDTLEPRPLREPRTVLKDTMQLDPVVDTFPPAPVAVRRSQPCSGGGRRRRSDDRVTCRRPR